MTNEGGTVFQKLPVSDYDALLAEVTAQGLFKRTYWHYAITEGVAVAGMAACLYAVTLTDSALFQVANAVFFTFFSVQAGIVGHDLSHGEVLESPTANRFWAMMVICLLAGLSESRWFLEHNTHHENPNHMGHDPSLDIPFVFSETQASERSPFAKRWILPYQHVLFWPALAFVYPYNIIYGMRFILSDISVRSLTELVLMTAHFAIVIGFPLYFLPLPIALLFLGTVFFTTGAYMGMVFAPNHKGEGILGEHEEFNWSHQITLTRDLYPSWPVFYFLGGLNFQIEHHLFPTMSRLQYWKAHTIVKDFCKKRGMRYHQTTWVGSMKEIHQSLKEEAQRWP